MRWISCVFAICAIAPACAQAAEDDWTNLKTLRRGQHIRVVDQSMRTWNGEFADVTDEAISLGGKTIPRSSVYHVTRASRTRNALIGLAAGAGAGAGLGVWASDRIDRGYGGAMSKGATATLLVVGCAAVGLAAGAAFPSHKTVYQGMPEATRKVSRIDPATYLYARQ